MKKCDSYWWWMSEKNQVKYVVCIYVYRKISNISRTKSQNLDVSHLGLQLSTQYIEDTCWVENEDMISVPAGDATITSEWSTI